MGDSLTLRAQSYGWNSLGERRVYFETTRRVPYRPWLTQSLAPLAVPMPNEPAVVVVAVRLEDAAGKVLSRNFCTFVVEGGTSEPSGAHVVRIDPARFDTAVWSLKQWNVMDGLKVNGAGSGFFQYRVPWPAGFRPTLLDSVMFVAELSAKELFGKDRDSASRMEGDYMRGQGTFDPSRNPNAYPMTDTKTFPSAVTVRVNGILVGREALQDDPADSRGILSWHFQRRDRYLREAGSYGSLVRVVIPRAALERAAAAGELVIRLEVDSALPGGLAIYGRRFGRYPLDPTLEFVRKP